ncbi:MAG TPA: MmgE/PrpD family protein [Candidatus Saccharimonadales bacterium]|jgi:2-methylcitrate dehydratase PrpD|nr:MmgE/PrpD family protein [Candidatus Saccharimonadales bacterium]
MPQPPEPVTRLLAEALASATYQQMPPEVIEDSRRSILDWLGSVLAGSLEPPARLAQRIVAGLGRSEEATVFGAGNASAAGAALANGVASHILELDDVHKGSTLHGAAPIIPAALAVAEREHASGRAFLLAVTLGYDAALRIGEAVNPSHYRFWHPTGTAATFGAAVAAGSLMKLNAAQMLDALGSAGTQASGLWEFNADGAMSKHLHAGKAAFNGVLAADLARVGFTGATRILEGERGFFRATSSSHDASRITDGLARRWKISENCFKMHSCCGHTHTAIDLALDLRAAQKWTGVEALEKAAKIHIQTYGPGYEIVSNCHPRSPYQAKFSIAYCVAAALLEGQVGLEQFPAERLSQEGVRHAGIAALLARTHVTVEPDLTAKYPAAWPARLTVTLKDGALWNGSSDYPRGNPENPVSTAALEEKFRALVSPRLGAAAAQRALANVKALDTCADMTDTFSGLTPTS